MSRLFFYLPQADNKRNKARLPVRLRYHMNSKIALPVCVVHGLAALLRLDFVLMMVPGTDGGVD